MLLLAGACSPERPRVVVSAPAPPATASSSPATLPDARAQAPRHRGFAVQLPPPVSPEVAAFFAAQPEVFSWKALQLFRAPPPPAGFVGLTAAPRTPFPGRAFAHVFFHTFGRDRAFRDPGVLDSGVAGCRFLIAADGRYCPSVSEPGLELRPAQVAELLRLLTEPQPLTKTRHASAPDDLGFVFTDERGVPVAQLAFNLAMPRVAAEPDLLRHEDWDPRRFQRLRELVFALDPLERAQWELSPQLREQWALDQGALPRAPYLSPGQARYLASRSSIDGNLRQSALTAQQREVACAWQALTWRQGVPRSGKTAGGGLECEGDVLRVGLAFTDCQREFPRCEAPLGEVEDCMRLQRFDPCLDESSAQHCRALRDCFWGMRVANQAERAYQRALESP